MVMKDNISHIRICPLCGEAFAGHPAISRTDNETLICPDCGTREALASIGICEAEREKIISIINRATRRNQHP